MLHYMPSFSGFFEAFMYVYVRVAALEWILNHVSFLLGTVPFH